MPTGTTPTGTSSQVGGFNVSHTNEVQFSISVQPGSFPTEDVEEATQDLINYLTAWPSRNTLYGPLEASKMNSENFAITVDEE